MFSRATPFGVDGFLREFVTRLRDGKGYLWGERGTKSFADSVVQDGLRIYNSGRRDGASIVMNMDISSKHKFLSIFFFSTPEQIDYIVEKYDVYAFSELLLAGSRPISKEWYGLLESHAEQHLHDSGYILLCVFILILKSQSEPNPKYFRRATRIFWGYMVRFMGKFYKTTWMSPDEIEVQYGKRTIRLRSEITDFKGYLQYICDDKAALRLDNIVLLLISRFSKGRWKDLIVESIEASSGTRAKEGNDILRGRDCKCQCDCEMIKDILLPERFVKMRMKIDSSLEEAK